MLDLVVAEHQKSTLKEFSDLFLEPTGAYYKISPTDSGRHVLQDANLKEDISLMRERLERHETGRDFRTSWNDCHWRVQRLMTMGGDIYVCRRLLDAPIPFVDLGFSAALRATLLKKDFIKSGLILWTGGTGDGKSVSQYSWMVERLKTHGGTAWTIENPVEIRVQGVHTGASGIAGTCYQIEIRKDSEYEEQFEQLLRASPNLMVFGEIRTAEVAALAVLAASTGHVVSATIHANNPVLALQRLRNLLSASRVDPAILGDCLLAVVHQRMKTMTFADKLNREIDVDPLVIATCKSATGLRTMIREGDFASLTSEIERQRSVLGDDGNGVL